MCICLFPGLVHNGYLRVSRRIGGKAKGDKVYTLRPCDGDQLFFDKIRRLSQAKGEDFEQMPNVRFSALL